MFRRLWLVGGITKILPGNKPEAIVWLPSLCAEAQVRLPRKLQVRLDVVKVGHKALVTASMSVRHECFGHCYC